MVVLKLFSAQILNRNIIKIMEFYNTDFKFPAIALVNQAVS